MVKELKITGIQVEDTYNLIYRFSLSDGDYFTVNLNTGIVHENDTTRLDLYKDITLEGVLIRMNQGCGTPLSRKDIYQRLEGLWGKLE